MTRSPGVPPPCRVTNLGQQVDSPFEGTQVSLPPGDAWTPSDPCQTIRFVTTFKEATSTGVRRRWARCPPWPRAATFHQEIGV